VSLGIYNTGNNHGNVYFYKDGTAKGWLKYRGDDDRLLLGNVTDAISILTDGDVAIGGSTSPDRLTVYKANVGNPTGITIRNTESSSTYSHARLRLESQNAAAYADIWADVANSALRFGYNSSSTVNIDNVGRLFVGGNGTIASSSERLTVRGMTMIKNDSTNVAPLYVQNANFTANTNQPYITLQDGSGNRGGIGVENNTSGMWLSGQNAIIFRGGTSSPGNAEWGRFNTDAYGGTFNVGPDTVGGFPTASARVNIYGNNQTQGTMRLEPHSDKGTNVSHVHYGTNGDWYIRSASSSGKVIINDNGAQTAIGHANPDSRFHVKSSSNHVATFEYSSTSDMAIQLKNSQGSMYFGLGGGEEFAVGTDADLNGTNCKFMVTNTGNCGVNTNNPTEKLHVVGGKIRQRGPGFTNLDQGDYYAFPCSRSIAPNTTKTFTFTGLQSGWMTIRGGGYSSAGQSQFSFMYHLGGYMTATHTYDVHTVRQWGSGVTISTTKNAQSFVISMTNNSSSYTLNVPMYIETSNSTVSVASN